MSTLNYKRIDPMPSELLIKNDINELEKLAAFIEQLGEEKELDMAMVMNLNLVLEEIVSNIILYAYPEKLGEEITIMCNEVDNKLIFTISN